MHLSSTIMVCILEKKIILNANEQKSFIKIAYWNKNRYYKQDDNEYFLNEKENYFIEIFINLGKEEFKNNLTEKQFSEIMNNKNFIKDNYCFSVKYKNIFNLNFG